MSTIHITCDWMTANALRQHASVMLDLLEENDGNLFQLVRSIPYTTLSGLQLAVSAVQHYKALHSCSEQRSSRRWTKRSGVFFCVGG